MTQLDDGRQAKAALTAEGVADVMCSAGWWVVVYIDGAGDVGLIGPVGSEGKTGNWERRVALAYLA